MIWHRIQQPAICISSMFGICTIHSFWSQCIDLNCCVNQNASQDGMYMYILYIVQANGNLLQITYQESTSMALHTNDRGYPRICSGISWVHCWVCGALLCRLAVSFLLLFLFILPEQVFFFFFLLSYQHAGGFCLFFEMRCEDMTDDYLYGLFCRYCLRCWCCWGFFVLCLGEGYVNQNIVWRIVLLCSLLSPLVWTTQTYTGRKWVFLWCKMFPPCC